MTNRFLLPPLAFRQVNDEHIYNGHVKEEEKKCGATLVGPVLRTIQSP
jgi:hypothetical protein